MNQELSSDELNSLVLNFKSEYGSNLIQTFSFQLMESANIILNSKNYDTVLSRIDFINKLLPKLKLGREIMHSYLIDVDIAVDRYSQIYPDKKPDNEAKLFLDNIENAKVITSEIYCISIYNCLGRNFAELIEALKTMKQEKAKLNRVEKFKELLIKAKSEISSRYNDAKSIDKIMNEIGKIETIVNTNDFNNTTFNRNG